MKTIAGYHLLHNKDRLNLFLTIETIPTMKQPKEQMYKTLAKYYDLVYSWKDYSVECKQITELINEYKLTEGTELLDVACGTGTHLTFLIDHFNVEGVDRNKEMLAVAKKKLRGIRFHQGDMKSFRLKKEFDVVTCLFSSIAYLKGYEDLEKTIKNFSSHLKSGGVMIIEPFVSKKKFLNNHIHVLNVEDENMKITRMTHGYKHGDRAMLDFHFLIGDGKKGVQYIHDPHDSFLFEEKKVLSIMKRQRLTAVYLADGLMVNRGLYIGMKK